MGLSVGSGAETHTSLAPIRGVDSSNYRYNLDEDGECWLTSPYLEDFFQQRVEGQLSQLRQRGVLTIKVSAEIGRPNNRIRNAAWNRYYKQRNAKERRRKRNDVVA